MQTTRWRARMAKGLLMRAAIGAVGAFFSSLPAALHVDAATPMVEIWRLVGFVVFAGLFGLLA